MDYTVHGILQARKLELVAIPFSRGSSQPRDQTQVSRTAGGFFTKKKKEKKRNSVVIKIQVFVIFLWMFCFQLKVNQTLVFSKIHILEKLTC